jgi:hypothetical protein
MRVFLRPELFNEHWCFAWFRTKFSHYDSWVRWVCDRTQVQSLVKLTMTIVPCLKKLLRVLVNPRMKSQLLLFLLKSLFRSSLSCYFQFGFSLFILAVQSVATILNLLLKYIFGVWFSNFIFLWHILEVKSLIHFLFILSFTLLEDAKWALTHFK